jgi:hypothetical protein
MSRVADELTGAVAGLADDNDTFMRRHAIKVETQVRRVTPARPLACCAVLCVCGRVRRPWARAGRELGEACVRLVSCALVREEGAVAMVTLQFCGSIWVGLVLGTSKSPWTELTPRPPPHTRTQVVDRAMSLLLELSQARRQALRAGEDSRAAMEAAFVAAQKQYAAHIDDLNNQLIVARCVVVVWWCGGVLRRGWCVLCRVCAWCMCVLVGGGRGRGNALVVQCSGVAIVLTRAVSVCFPVFTHPSRPPPLPSGPTPPSCGVSSRRLRWRRSLRCVVGRVRAD